MLLTPLWQAQAWFLAFLEESSFTTNETSPPSRPSQSATSTGEPRQMPEKYQGKYSSAGIS